jgi:hypothetical protein
MSMPVQVFVPLRKYDSIEEIISYINVLARPGMTIVFLVKYRLEVSWMHIQLTAMQAGLKPTTAFETVAANVSRERQLRWVQEKIYPAEAALRSKGVSLVVQTYTGSLRTTLASLRESQNPIVVLSAPSKIVSRIISRLKNLTPRSRNSDGGPVVFFRPSRQY